MDFISVHFYFKNQILNKEILIAFLDLLGFESFEDDDNGILAYIQENNFNECAVKKLLQEHFSNMEINYNYEKISNQNWNELWESNYKPVIIKGKCVVRAPFHKIDPAIKYNIIIEPQMSFGTAHHETTAMMLEYILEHNFKGSTVLDMGCGTAVLAILASMKGAKKITAIDNDILAYQNSISNIKKNNLSNIKVIYGDATKLKGKYFDVIFANINRNILLTDMQYYTETLKKKGRIYFSGFFEKDLNLIRKKSLEFKLEFINKKSNNNWVAAYFNKK